MLHNSALKMTNWLSRYTNISEDEMCIYTYGFELLLSTILSALSLLLISILFGKPTFFLTFIITFYVQRLFCGGYHAQTYFRCFVLTNFIFISTIVFSQTTLMFNIKHIIPLLMLLSFVIIIRYAPIENPNHPYSEMQHYRFKSISRALALLILIGWFAICYYSGYTVVLICMALSYIWVAIMLIITKIKLKGGKD